MEGHVEPVILLGLSGGRISQPIYFYTEELLLVPHQFQIKHSFTSAWVHRPADPVFQCYLAGSSVIFLPYFEVFFVAGCCLREYLISYPVRTSVRVTFPFSEQKSLHFLSQDVDMKRNRRRKLVSL